MYKNYCEKIYIKCSLCLQSVSNGLFVYLQLFSYPHGGDLVTDRLLNAQEDADDDH